MRGIDQQQPALFSYVSLDQRVPAEHPLRIVRPMVDTPYGAGRSAWRRSMPTRGGPPYCIFWPNLNTHSDCT